MSTTIEVTQSDFHVLLKMFVKNAFHAAACEEGTVYEEILKKCECLFKQDYTLIELDNTNGNLSARYPTRIFIPEYAHGHMSSTLTANNSNLFNQSTTNTTQQNFTIINGFHQNTSCLNASSSTAASTSNGIHASVTFANTPVQQSQQSQYPNPQANLQYQQHLLQQTPTANVPVTNTITSTIYEDLCDIGKIRELITMAKYARCRQRFAVPVIMYRGKYICRGATLSINAETYGRKAVDYAYDYLSGTNYSNRAVDDENNDNREDSLVNISPFSYDEVIKSDKQLLNAFNVTTIVDLMVEKRKVKYFLTVSSSEKADPDNHYENFNLLSLPYPGCEFFKNFRDNNYMAKNLHYNWNQSFIDTKISVPKLGCITELNINWNEYKDWDLVQITQNYLKACLKYIQEEKSGLLIHCISGWDRTPLFISLVRLSLWADDLIHQSLSPIQMTYLTLAYDWYLFGHQLPDRRDRGEDIMFFCFHVLKFLIDEEFSIVEYRKRTKTSSSSSSSIMVIKSDCCDDEPLKEDFVLGCDQDSNDSFSNSSICDMSITDNFYSSATTASAHGTCNNSVGGNPLTNRSPNPKRSRTSPISVPGASATRQRQESTSSNESWQVVTDTGSIDSMMNGSYMMRFTSQQDGSSSSNNAAGNSNSSNTPSNSSNNSGSSTNATNNLNPKDTLPTTKTSAALRKYRLNAVRAIFIQSYGKTVGLKFKEGSSMNLTAFIGTIAEQLF